MATQAKSMPSSFAAKAATDDGMDLAIWWKQAFPVATSAHRLFPAAKAMGLLRSLRVYIPMDNSTSDFFGESNSWQIE